MSKLEALGITALALLAYNGYVYVAIAYGAHGDYNVLNFPLKIFSLI